MWVPNAHLHYERRLINTLKTIDFCVEALGAGLEWIDMKNSCTRVAGR